jgi:hypothetical protein
MRPACTISTEVWSGKSKNNTFSTKFGPKIPMITQFQSNLAQKLKNYATSSKNWRKNTQNAKFKPKLDPKNSKT